MIINRLTDLLLGVFGNVMLTFHASFIFCTPSELDEDRYNRMSVQCAIIILPCFDHQIERQRHDTDILLFVN